MTGDDFRALLDQLATDWRAGDAAAVAAAFAPDVRYQDPLRYRFDRREDLLPFFEPPEGGHDVIWHRSIWDDSAQTGVAEYTYTGHHRYHGAVIVVVGGDGRIRDWREWQHLDDARDWSALLDGEPR